MIEEQIYFVLAILETGQLIGDCIPNTTPLQKKSRMAREKLFYRGFFFSPKNLPGKGLGSAQTFEIPENSGQKLCEIDNFPIKSSTRNMGYCNTGNKETNQEL